MARTTLASFLNPYANDGDPFESPFVVTFDADPGIDGNQLSQERQVDFSEVTGRFVIDYQVTPDNLVYGSYSRGYKRSEEHTSELQSLMRISYAVFCLNKQNYHSNPKRTKHKHIPKKQTKPS